MISQILKAAILVLVLFGELKGQGIQSIELTFTHSLRIPYNKVEVKAMSFGDKYTLAVKGEPMNNDPKWAKTKVDTTYALTSQEFNQIKTMVTSLSPGDIIKSMGGWGFDGTIWQLSFGGFQNKITYQVWTIDYKTKERGLEKYVEVVDFILSLGHLDYRKIK